MDDDESPAAPVQGLVVVDMQTGFLTGSAAAPGSVPVAAAVDRLLAAARAARALVVHLRNSGPAGAVDEPGTATWELHREPSPGELVIDKTLDDGFAGTSLGPDLERHGIRRLAVCGVMSEMCVAATVRGALDRGYGVVLPHTAHGTFDVPPGPGGSPGVPAALAARAAEWALGDGVQIVADPSAVRFVAAWARPGAASPGVCAPGPSGTGPSTCRSRGEST